MILAIDFDGTIVEHRYPKIGEEMLFAFDALKELNNQGHKLILWTYRSGKELDEAVQYCKDNGVRFYAINSNTPGEKFDEETMSRKILADIYIDDRNVGGFPGWGEIMQMLSPDFERKHLEEMRKIRKKGKNKFLRFFG